MELPPRRLLMTMFTVSCYPHEPFTPGIWALPCATWGEYLEKEKARIMRDGDRVAEIRTRSDGRVSLWVERVAG